MQYLIPGNLEHYYDFDSGRAKPAIYSPQVVMVFSILFSGLAGGVLTHSSLKAAGQPVEAQRALKASFIFFAVLLFISFVLPLRSAGTGLSLGLGYGWGYYMNEFFLKKCLPDEASYPRKSWAKPLLICLAVLIGVFGLAGALTTL